jgi:hypothetical protein
MSRLYEQGVREHLTKLGIPPHLINNLVRESEEEIHDAEEVVKYLREIMGRTEYLELVLLRAFVISFSERHKDSPPADIAAAGQVLERMMGGVIRLTCVQLVLEQAIDADTQKGS